MFVCSSYPWDYFLTSSIPDSTFLLRQSVISNHFPSKLSLLSWPKGHPAHCPLKETTAGVASISQSWERSNSNQCPLSTIAFELHARKLKHKAGWQRVCVPSESGPRVGARSKRKVGEEGKRREQSPDVPKEEPHGTIMASSQIPLEDMTT